MTEAMSRVSATLVATLFASVFSAAALASQQPGHFARIVLSDSVSAEVHIGTSDTSVTVRTPAGAFRLRADSSALAAWAKASARLPAPRPATDSAGPLKLSAAILRATDQSGNAMRFVRLNGDSLPPYQLAVANGAWEYAERISPEQARKLFTALAGEQGAGGETVKWVSDTPVIAGFAFGVGDYRPPEPVPGTQHPKYPAHADFLRADGEVVAQFLVDTTGLARPETLLIVRATHPLFSISVRDALPEMRFRPAMLNGRKIQEFVVQTFQFNVPIR